MGDRISVRGSDVGDTNPFPTTKIPKGSYLPTKTFTSSINTTVSVANATTAPTLTATGSGATLPTATYFVQYSYTNANGQTLVSAEASQAITLGQPLGITVPALPSGATGVNYFVSSSTTTETLQSSQAGITLSITAPLVAGAAKPIVSTINTNIVSLYTVTAAKTFYLTDFSSSNNSANSVQVSVNASSVAGTSPMYVGYSSNTSPLSALNIGTEPSAIASTAVTFQVVSAATATSVSYFVSGYEQ